MNQQLMNELIDKVDRLWFGHQIDQIFAYIQIPIAILSVIVLYKINQVLKIYIEDNKDFL